MAGITGTNGKTTTAFLLREVLEAAAIQCGLLGTVKQVVGAVEEEVERTTPEAIDLQETFRRMLEGGDRACAMEVSSHALALHRADAIHFELALFTNLTQDHLDFHADMEDYFLAKRRLFEAGPETALVNVDDPTGGAWQRDFECLTFSAEGAAADFSARDVTFDASGAEFEVGGIAVRTALPGHFNVANALGRLRGRDRDGGGSGRGRRGAGQGASCAGPASSRSTRARASRCSSTTPTPRTRSTTSCGAARRLTEGRVISVFGAGGDRDRDKRPKMGRAGARGSDLAIVTSGQPALRGPRGDHRRSPGRRRDRERSRVGARPARRDRARLRAREPGDTVVIAGKGHEQGQEFEDGRKIPFDDREVAREELRRIGGGEG